MKKILALLFAFALLVVFQPPTLQASPDNSSGTSYVLHQQDIAPAAVAQEEGGVVVDPGTASPTIESKGIGGFFLDNWATLLLSLFAFLKIIVNLTPTESDNKIFGLLDNLINFLVPNYKKGGGTF
jgi:hypothetical protein